MLSGISHDLDSFNKIKTSTGNDQSKIYLIVCQKTSMKWKVCNDYLQFAKTQTQEKTTEINLAKILNEISDSLKALI